MSVAINCDPKVFYFFLDLDAINLLDAFHVLSVSHYLALGDLLFKPWASRDSTAFSASTASSWSSASTSRYHGRGDSQIFVDVIKGNTSGGGLRQVLIM